MSTRSNAPVSNRFPLFLTSDTERNTLGQRIVLTILKFAKKEGGYNSCFGYRKKRKFLEKAHRVLFDFDGPSSSRE